MRDAGGPRYTGEAAAAARPLRQAPPPAAQGRLLGIQKSFVCDVAAAAIALADGCDPAVAGNAPRIAAELGREEAKFVQTLETGACPTLLYPYARAAAPARCLPPRPRARPLRGLGRGVLRRRGNLPACWHAGAWLLRAPGPCLLTQRPAPSCTLVYRLRPSVCTFRTRGYCCRPCHCTDCKPRLHQPAR